MRYSEESIMELRLVPHYAASMFGNGLTALWALIAGAALAYWQAAPQALQAALVGALCCTLADSILAVAVCLVRPDTGRRFSSTRFARVLVKLLVYMCGLLAAFGMDNMVGPALGATGLFQLTMAILICVREFGSLLEHSAELGFPWPDAIQRRLEIVRRRVDEYLEDLEEASEKAGEDDGR